MAWWRPALRAAISALFRAMVLIGAEKSNRTETGKGTSSTRAANEFRVHRAFALKGRSFVALANFSAASLAVEVHFPLLRMAF